MGCCICRLRDTCLEMFKPGAKLEDKKYDICKCWIPCAGKKMKLMTDTGRLVDAEVLKVLNSLKTAGFKEEGLRVYEICKKVEGKDCALGFNMATCVLKNSEMAKNLVTGLLQTFQR